MDSAILREREAFMQKAFATVVVSKCSQFGVLAKIINHLKALHQDGADHSFTLEEILDKTDQLGVGMEITQWLKSQALKSNPKIETTSDEKYKFKPSYKVKDRKGLLRLLRNNNLKGCGGILLKDIKESLPKYEKVLKQLEKEIVLIDDPVDKILFYNDKTVLMPIDEEFQMLWRSVPVNKTDDRIIEEYLANQGIRSMQDTRPHLVLPAKLESKAAPKKRTSKRPRDNEHLKGILEEYGEIAE